MKRTLALVLTMFLATPAFAHEGAPVVLSRMPDDVPGLFARAEAYKNLRRFEDAVVALEIATALAPTERKVWLALGRIERARGEWAAADAAFTRFLELGSPTFVAHWLRGKTREAQNETELAIADYRAAVSITPRVEGFRDLGRLLEQTGRIDEARLVYRTGVEHTRAGILSRRLATVEVELDPRAAIATIDAAIANARVRTEWLLLRARAHEALGDESSAAADRRDALADAERLLERRPAPAVLLSRAEALVALGREREAIADLENALRRAPRLDRARALLSSIGGAK